MEISVFELNTRVLDPQRLFPKIQAIHHNGRRIHEQIISTKALVFLVIVKVVMNGINITRNADGAITDIKGFCRSPSCSHWRRQTRRTNELVCQDQDHNSLLGGKSLNGFGPKDEGKDIESIRVAGEEKEIMETKDMIEQRRTKSQKRKTLNTNTISRCAAWSTDSDLEINTENRESGRKDTSSTLEAISITFSPHCTNGTPHNYHLLRSGPSANSSSQNHTKIMKSEQLNLSSAGPHCSSELKFPQTQLLRLYPPEAFMGPTLNSTSS
ncbi:hypothetical protein C8R45DRAFT_920322 [Mycena sanguinolenta]|nr:hypothetical protein C8R45DRAFT_920322 [Mycena sanguinolenta]